MTDKLEQEPVAWMADDGSVCSKTYKLTCLEKRHSDRYTTPLYTSPPNAKAITAAALMEAVKALEANEQFYARDTIQSLIDTAPTREDE